MLLFEASLYKLGIWLLVINQIKTTEPIQLRICVNVAQDVDSTQTYLCFLFKYFTRFIVGDR